MPVYNDILSSVINHLVDTFGMLEALYLDNFAVLI